MAGLAFSILEALERDFALLKSRVLANAGGGVGLEGNLAFVLFSGGLGGILRAEDAGGLSMEDEEEDVATDAKDLERPRAGERGRAHFTVFRVLGAWLMRGVAGAGPVLLFSRSTSLAERGEVVSRPSGPSPFPFCISESPANEVAGSAAVELTLIEPFAEEDEELHSSVLDQCVPGGSKGSSSELLKEPRLLPLSPAQILSSERRA